MVSGIRGISGVSGINLKSGRDEDLQVCFFVLNLPIYNNKIVNVGRH